MKKTSISGVVTLEDWAGDVQDISADCLGYSLEYKVNAEDVTGFQEPANFTPGMFISSLTLDVIWNFDADRATHVILGILGLYPVTLSMQPEPGGLTWTGKVFCDGVTIQGNVQGTAISLGSIHFSIVGDGAAGSVLYASSTMLLASQANDTPNGGWSANLNPVYLDDDNDISSAVSAGDVTSDTLDIKILTNALIPPLATLTGFQIIVKRRATQHGVGDRVYDITAQMRLSGTYVGTNHANGTDWDPTWAYHYITYGGQNDMMGTTITTADVLAGNVSFGMQVAKHQNGVQAPIPQIDIITIEVFYLTHRITLM